MLAHRQVPDLAATTRQERDEVAVLYPRILTALDRLYDTAMPYIAAWHQAPVHQGRADIRLMLQVTSPGGRRTSSSTPRGRRREWAPSSATSCRRSQPPG